MNHLYYVPTTLQDIDVHADSKDNIMPLLAENKAGYNIEEDKYYEVRDAFMFKFTLPIDIQGNDEGGDIKGYNLIKNFHRNISGLADISMLDPRDANVRDEHVLNEAWCGVTDIAQAQQPIELVTGATALNVVITPDRRGVVLLVKPGLGRPVFRTGSTLRFTAYCINFEALFGRNLETL